MILLKCRFTNQSACSVGKQNLIISITCLLTDSEELSDFSEPNTPHLHLSPKNSLTLQQDEINRKYQELQQQISLEFQAKQKEWERIRTSSVAVSCPGWFSVLNEKKN